MAIITVSGLLRLCCRRWKRHNATTGRACVPHACGAAACGPWGGGGGGYPFTAQWQGFLMIRPHHPTRAAMPALTPPPSRGGALLTTPAPQPATWRSASLPAARACAPRPPARTTTTPTPATLPQLYLRTCVSGWRHCYARCTPARPGNRGAARRVYNRGAVPTAAPVSTYFIFQRKPQLSFSLPRSSRAPRMRRGWGRQLAWGGARPWSRHLEPPPHGHVPVSQCSSTHPEQSCVAPCPPLA